MPFISIASLIGFAGNSLTYSAYSISGYSIFIFFIFSCIYSSFSMRSCNYFSFSLAAASTCCIASSLNISFSFSYLACALIATIMTMHSSGVYFSSTNSLPFKNVMVSQSSKPLSISNLIRSMLRWSQSLSIKPYIGLPYII